MPALEMMPLRRGRILLLGVALLGARVLEGVLGEEIGGEEIGRMKALFRER